jgi:hypothetical protein
MGVYLVAVILQEGVTLKFTCHTKITHRAQQKHDTQSNKISEGFITHNEYNAKKKCFQEFGNCVKQDYVADDRSL